jgi:nucleoside-diphosphate-sugar epimerase
MKTVAITGVSGFIGRNLAAYLVGQGFRVCGSDLYRHPELIAGVDFKQVDVLHPEVLREWCHAIKPEYLVHLAARTDLLGTSMADYSANTEGVDNVMAVCAGLASLRRVIFASSRMVCRIEYIPNSYEDYCPPNWYGRSKVEGERRVRRAKPKPTYDWVMVRPTSIWGPGFGIPYRNFFDQVRLNRYFHQRGHNPAKSFGYIGNSVFQISRLLDAPREQIHERTFYLGDYQPVKVRDWADCIHAEFGLPRRIPTLPMSLLKIAAVVGDVFNRIGGGDKAPLTTFRLNNLITNMVYPQLADLEKITGPLPHDWREGTKLTVGWMKQKTLD